MLVGRIKRVDDDEVAVANQAREAKWAATAALKSRQVTAQEENATTDRIKAGSEAIATQTGVKAQRETARSNIATEGLTRSRNTADAAYQAGSLDNDTRQTALQGIEYAQKAPLIKAQTAQAQSETEKASAESKRITSGLRMRDQYTDPSTDAGTRQRIAGLYQAESGAAPRDTTHVIPGQTVMETDAKGRPVEVLKPPLIVDEAQGIFREAKPESRVFGSPAEKLESFKGTPRQKEAEEEYIRRYKSLPQGYTGGK